MTKDAEVVNNPRIDANKILTFPSGIPGFEKYTTYIVYHKEISYSNYSGRRTQGPAPYGIIPPSSIHRRGASPWAPVCTYGNCLLQTAQKSSG
jgi:hypothetical protein